MRVLRVYHGGRNPEHRARERALAAGDIELTLVVPAAWPEDGERPFAESAFTVVELPVLRAATSIVTATEIQQRSQR